MNSVGETRELGRLGLANGFRSGPSPTLGVSTEAAYSAADALKLSQRCGVDNPPPASDYPESLPQRRLPIVSIAPLCAA